MSGRKPFLFLTLLALATLAQIIFLHWKPETIFFATWLLVSFTVRHDSRLSAGVGLAFLASCPFLLLFRKEAVAEQAANYAYFFLAIGVLIQLEEMLLERYGWLGLKVDLSPLFAPARDAFRATWSKEAGRLRHHLDAQALAHLARLVQILGTLGLVLAFAASVLLGSLQAAVPLLVAALVLPLVVWALALAVRIWGPRILLSSAWVLVLLPLGTLGLVQLHDLQERVRLNETPLYYSFIDSFSLATHNSADPNLVGMRVWTVDGSTGRVLFAHPDLQSGHTRIEYTVDVPQDALVLSGVAMAPESWNQEGDGVQFSLYVEDEKGAHLLFERYLDPKHNPQDRAMYSFHTDLGEYAGPGRRFIFITDGGPQGDLRYDWAGWVEPRILSFARLAPSRPPPAGQGTPTATPLPTETPVPTATVTVSSGPQPTPLVTITPVPTGTVTPAARTSSPPYTSSVPR